MSGTLFFLYWPDFHGCDPSLSRSLTGHSLHRYLCALYEDFEAFVWDPETGTRSEFARWGLRLLADPPDGESIGAAVRSGPPPDLVILAMGTERAEPIRRRLEAEGTACEVWCAAGGGDRSLRAALHLDTAHAVKLLIDEAALNAFAVEVQCGPDTLRSRVIEVAGMVGSVVQALQFGPDGVLDLAGVRPGASTPGDLLQHLRTSPTAEDARTWILVGHAEWLSEAVRLAHEAGRRFLLWAPDESRVAPKVLAAADGWCPLTAVLGLPPRVPRRAAIRADVRIAAHTSTRPVEAADGEGVTRTLLPQQTLSESARLGSWVRLMYHVECVQRRHASTRMAFERLASELAELDEFGPAPANGASWLNRARVENLITIEPGPGAEGGWCRANGDHPVCRAAVEVPDRCLRLLFQMLQKIPWVSFKLLRSVLMRDQWLGGPPYRLDETTVDEWLNFLIHSGAIRMTKEPNLVNPDYPVTALRLNETHPLSRSVASDATETTRLAAERAILAVDHFLTRNRKPWMAMGALRRSLDGMSREELQAVLQGLQNLGALITESYPNPQKEHFTTGCRLKLDEPIVARALHIRNTIIQVTLRHADEREWVPLSRLEEGLSGLAEAASSAQRLAWISLLRDEGILEIDPDAHLPHAPHDAQCRLNFGDAVVRSVIAGPGQTPSSHGVG